MFKPKIAEKNSMTTHHVLVDLHEFSDHNGDVLVAQPFDDGTEVNFAHEPMILTVDTGETVHKFLKI